MRRQVRRLRRSLSWVLQHGARVALQPGRLGTRQRRLLLTSPRASAPIPANSVPASPSSQASSPRP